jgi:hypothetical protein
MTARFPLGTGNSPKVWTPTPDNFPLIEVRAGTWVRVELSYRNTNTMPVWSVQGGGGGPFTGGFQAHVIFAASADDSQFQKDGGRLQPTMYGGSATKQTTAYHIDPGWTFQAPWDGKVSIMSGGVSDPSVQIDVIVKLGYTPEALVTMPYPAESMLDGLHLTEKPHSQRVYAPPVVGHPGSVPATYVFIQPPGNIASFFPAGLIHVPFPPGATAMQITDSVAITPAPVLIDITSLGVASRMPFASGVIEQLGSLTQGGGTSTDGVVAVWTPVANTIFKVVIWSKLGN